MLNIWLKLKNYSKTHAFNLVVLVALSIIGAIQISQYLLIGSVYGLTIINNKALEDHVIQYEENRADDIDSLSLSLDTAKAELVEYADHQKMEIDARIDILDSAIDPEDKRRMQIVKIRKAIVENTDTKLNIRNLNNIATAVLDYSYQYNLSIAKILSQIKQESDFKIGAKSRARAQGLMQIIPETWEYVILKEFERKSADPYNIFNNVRAGCFYMAEQIHKFDTYDQALMAYNWGPHNVRSLLAGELTEEDIPRETTNYVKLINRNIAIFEKYGLE